LRSIEAKQELEEQNMALGDKLQEAVNAYTWEQNQLKVWAKALDMVPPDNTTGPVGPVFQSIWKSYFQNVSVSNDAIIKFCQKAINTGDPNKIQNAVDKLNKIEHEQAGVQAVEKEARQHATKSPYFTQLDILMGLEVQARNYLEQYLV
jgi:hypothetical protein